MSRQKEDGVWTISAPFKEWNISICYDNRVIASEDLKTNETYTLCVDGEETSTVTIADTLTKA